MEQDYVDNFYAPIVIPTLNRYEHLKRCIGSLSICTGARNTVLVIGLDYPPSYKYEEGYKKIKEYLPTISGFRNVVILEAQKNLGTKENCLRLYDYIRNKGYNKYIFTEDDNEFSPNFLEYMNKGLAKYECNSKIMMISGYSYPDVLHMELTSNVVAFHKAAAWGCGRWFNKEFTYSKVGAENYRDMILYSWRKSFVLLKKRAISLNSLISMKFRNTTYGDSLMIDCLILENKYCVFPKLSKVRNWGHDGSGEHSGLTNLYKNQSIDYKNCFVYDELEYSEIMPYDYNANNIVLYWLKKTIVYPFVVFTRYIFFRLFAKDMYYFRFERKD